MMSLAIEVTTETPKNDPLQDGFVSHGQVGRMPYNDDGSHDCQYGNGQRYEHMGTPTIEKMRSQCEA
jgi:hypothetical protein